MKLYRLLLVGGVLLVAAGLAFGVGYTALAQEAPPNPVGEPPTFLRAIYDAWVASPHAKVDAEAFVHWNEAEDKKIPVECARCHSTPGYIDYMGEDGTAFGAVDNPADIGTVINCDACHNPTAQTLRAVTFPSGVELTNLDDAARCMVCHQGRASTATVNTAIENAGVTDLNAVSEDLRFINIHYYAAAASLYGAEVHGGYEFEGKTYQPRFDHVEGKNTCIGCHNPHTQQVKVNECTTCHEGVESLEDLKNVRMNGSLIDYDGDGDMEEGIANEITTLQDMLYQAIQLYASEVIGTPILYDEASYPYFFVDTNANGVADEGEVTGDNAYPSFSAHLVQATYNLQVTKKDPGKFAHNAKYHIALLYDTIEMLNGELAEGVDLSKANRNDPGHFDATGEPFRHWDAEGEVPGSCAKCHTAGGLGVFMHNGVNIATKPSNGLACSTCHDSIPEFTLYSLAEVKFPSGAVVSFGEGEAANLCLNCHQGRESTVSVNNAIKAAGVGDDEVSDKLAFRNVHYFAAGATLFGTEVKGAYEFEGKEYMGRNEHTRQFDQCTDCHDVHALTVRFEECSDCHENVEIASQEDVFKIRAGEDDIQIVPVDYDGDGNVTEPIADEIATLRDTLYAAIQDYATSTIGTGIVYNTNAYPYFFVDTNGDGAADPDEVNSDNRYVTWTPKLLRAAYNYQYSIKDPGVFAHNPRYILQILYDSIESVGGAEAVANFTRAPMEYEES